MANSRSLSLEALPDEALSGDDGHCIEVTIVIPMHDEQDNVEPLYRSLVDALERLGRSFEIIVVDDGSRDETYPRLVGLA